MDIKYSIVFDNAANLLERSEWIQGDFWVTDDGKSLNYANPETTEVPKQFCLMGAVYWELFKKLRPSDATGQERYSLSDDAYLELERTRAFDIMDDGYIEHDPITYNDNYAQNKEDVISRLRIAAEIEREKEAEKLI